MHGILICSGIRWVVSHKTLAQVVLTLSETVYGCYSSAAKGVILPAFETRCRHYMLTWLLQ